MVQTIETEKIYRIPIEDTDPNWVQTQEIPVTYKETLIGTTTYIHLGFPTDHEYAPYISAGDPGNVEKASTRIKTQMIHRLERDLAVLDTESSHSSNLLSYCTSEKKQIGQYFSPRV